jgi:FKBP-type peptidyl-prolyl cis-trans isomerase
MNKPVPALSVPILALTLVLGAGAGACKTGAKTGASTGETREPPAAGGGASASGGLLVQEIKVGDGAQAVAGKLVSVSYTGTRTDGSKFDSTADHGGRPIEFLLGTGKVIKGWDQGIDGMRVGGRRRLTIPPRLAYGERGMGPIPPNATLVFDVELMGVR